MAEKLFQNGERSCYLLPEDVGSESDWLAIGIISSPKSNGIWFWLFVSPIY